MAFGDGQIRLNELARHYIADYLGEDLSDIFIHHVESQGENVKVSFKRKIKYEERWVDIVQDISLAYLMAFTFNRVLALEKKQEGTAKAVSFFAKQPYLPLDDKS